MDDPWKFEFGVPTRLCPARLKSARYDVDGKILVSLFHQGAGIIIDKATGEHRLAGAQQATKYIPRVGFISSAGAPGTPSPLFDAFRFGLWALGYVDSKNILIESRYAEGRLDRMPALVNDLVQQKVAVIFAVNNVVIRAAKEATKTIPIVIL